MIRHLSTVAGASAAAGDLGLLSRPSEERANPRPPWVAGHSARSPPGVEWVPASHKTFRHRPCCAPSNHRCDGGKRDLSNREPERKQASPRWVFPDWRIGLSGTSALLLARRLACSSSSRGQGSARTFGTCLQGTQPKRRLPCRARNHRVCLR
jgi:hypothetical protein